MKYPRWKTAIKILLAVILLYAATQISHRIAESVAIELRPSNEDAVHRLIMLSAFLYSCLLAIPFVPGAEIGIALLAVLGPPISFLVYTCTVIGLCLSYLIGRYVPLKVLRAIAEAMKLSRLVQLLKQVEPLDRKERIRFLAGRDNKLLSAFIQNRHVGLALLLNLPGNFLIGGGGGIGLIAGMSGLYSIFGYLITVMIAASPVPILVSMFGAGFLA